MAGDVRELIRMRYGVPPSGRAGVVWLGKKRTESMSFVAGRAVVIDYTNWEGRRSKRVVTPTGALEWIEAGTNKWHPEAQWLVPAWDHAKGEVRGFALSGIHPGTRAATDGEVREAEAQAAS